MTNSTELPAVLGPVERQVRPGAEARHLPMPEDLRSYADDADQHGNHWVPIAPASLRGLADEIDRLKAHAVVLANTEFEVERERCAKAVDHILREGGGTWGDWIRAGCEPPCCAGGPQWGHAWDCKKCPD